MIAMSSERESASMPLRSMRSRGRSSSGKHLSADAIKITLLTDQKGLDLMFKAARNLQLDQDIVFFVLAAKNSAFAHQFANKTIVTLWNATVDDFSQQRFFLDHHLHQIVKSCSLEGGNSHCFGVFDAELRNNIGILTLIDLIEDSNDRVIFGAKFFEDLSCRFCLLFCFGMADIDQM